MAGDWIAMRHDLAETAEVLRMASALGCSRFEVVGKLHAVWSWFDRQTTDGHARGVTLVTLMSHLDQAAGCIGFAKTMLEAGWLRGGKGIAELPNFGRWNGKTAKERLLAARRQREKRVTVTSRSKRDKNVTTGQDRTGEKQESSSSKNEELLSARKTARAILVGRFEGFWRDYPRREGKRGPKPKALTKWLSMPEKDRDLAEKGLSRYAEGAGDFPVDAIRYLQNRRWEDEVDTGPSAKDAAEAALWEERRRLYGGGA